jgi:hypothetical protein
VILGLQSLAVLVLAALVGCGGIRERAASEAMNRAAERYVRLVLAMTPHDEDYVDAYFGPPEWKSEAARNPMPLTAIRSATDSLVAALESMPPFAGAAAGKGLSPNRARRLYLLQQLRALSARCAILSGEKMPFDQESRVLYGVVAPLYGDAMFLRAIARLDSLLPGAGPLTRRYGAFRKQYVIPEDRLGAVMAATIRECRERTRRHIALPDSERYIVEYVTGKSWPAYNWYQGGYRSVIQVNMDQPTYAGGPIALGCHEGYPGHHVYNVLHEERLVRERGWVEYTIYPLHSPESLIAEGSAELGIEIAFPGRERLEFEKRTIFPLAGLDSSKAERYEEVRTLQRLIRYGSIEAARRYLDGTATRAQTIDWLMANALTTRGEAEQAVEFFTQYRSYVVNYALGTDMLRSYLKSRGAAPMGSERSWEEFGRIISSPSIVSEYR